MSNENDPYYCIDNLFLKYRTDHNLNKFDKRLKRAIKTNTIDINNKINCIFIKACDQNYYEIVKYLINMFELYTGEKINIQMLNELPFYYACRNGNMQIIKYLIKTIKKYSCKYIFVFKFDQIHYTSFLPIVHKYLASIGKYNYYEHKKRYNNIVKKLIL